MFGNLEELWAREALATVAREYAARLKPEGRTKALEWVDLIFQKWKLERSAPDGTIEISPFSVGLLSGGSLALSDLANPERTRRVPATDVRPEQCAGPTVRCTFDLLMHLFHEKYPPLIQMANKVPLFVVGALLAARDYKTMPLGRIASAIHDFWSITEAECEAAYAELGKELSKRAKQRVAAQTNGQLANAERKRRRDDAIDKMATQYFAAKPTARDSEAATHIHQTAQANGWRDFSNVTASGIERSLKDREIRRRTLESLARESK